MQIQTMCPSCRRYWASQAKAAAAVEGNITIGIDLAALRNISTRPRAFAHTRRRFGVDAQHGKNCINVARRYGDRRDVTARLSWDALVALASPTLPAATRQRMESTIADGVRVTANDKREQAK
jgi:hypothetical protein